MMRNEIVLFGKAIERIVIAVDPLCSKLDPERTRAPNRTGGANPFTQLNAPHSTSDVTAAYRKTTFHL
jgi:hypothetical protein